MKTLVKILCLCLFWFSCEELTDSDSTQISEYSLLLIKKDNKFKLFETSDGNTSLDVKFIYNLDVENDINSYEECWYYDWYTGECWDWYTYEYCTGQNVTYTFDGYIVEVERSIEQDTILYEEFYEYDDNQQEYDFYDPSNYCYQWYSGEFITSDCGYDRLDCLVSDFSSNVYSTNLIEIDQEQNFLYYSSGYNSENIEIIDLEGYRILYSK